MTPGKQLGSPPRCSTTYLLNDDMSKGATQPTVRETADETKKYELDTNLPDEAQGKTARGKHKSKQSTEDEHDATGSVEKHS